MDHEFPFDFESAKVLPSSLLNEVSFTLFNKRDEGQVKKILKELIKDGILIEESASKFKNSETLTNVLREKYFF